MGHWSAGSWNDRCELIHKLHSRAPSTALLSGAGGLAQCGGDLSLGLLVNGGGRQPRYGFK